MPKAVLFACILVVLLMWPVVGRMNRTTQPGGAADPKPTTTAQRGAARGGQQPRPGTVGHDDYRIPAGAVVSATLRTTVGSATSAAGDQVDATIAEAVTQDGVELLPEGSVMRGTVVDALAATPKALRGRIAIMFFVIEHRSTNSRAAIKSRPIVIDAEAPSDKKPVDVELAAGQSLRVVLSEPLIVRIPK